MAKILWVPAPGGDHQPIPGFLQNSDFQFNQLDLTEKQMGRKDFLLKYTEDSAIDLILAMSGKTDSLLLEFLEENRETPLILLIAPGSIKQLHKFLDTGAADYLIMDKRGEYLQLLPYIIERNLVIKHLKKQLFRVPPSEQEYEAIVQNMPDIVYKIDPMGYFSFVNKAVRVLEYEPEDLIGKHFKELLHPEDYSKVAWQEIIKNQETAPSSASRLFNERRQDQRSSYAQEIRLIPKSWKKQTRDVVIGSMTVIGQMNARGHYSEKDGFCDFLGTVGIIFNITREKQSQILIRKLFQVTDQSPISIIITDTQGRIEYVNPHFLHLNGYTQQEIVGIEISRLKPSRIHPGSYTDYGQIIRDGRSWQGEVISQRKDESYFWESVMIKPLADSEGKIINYVLIKVDITELKETQEVLKTINNELDRRVKRRTRELERINKELQQEIEERRYAQEQQQKLEAQLLQAQKLETIGTLAGGIAHDFNNILTPILGFANIAQWEIGTGNPGYEEVQQIRTAAGRARDLVQQILSFASVVDPKRIPVEIESILNEALNLIRASLPSTLEIRKEGTLTSGLILANPSQIHQVIINLCTNAAHAMKGSYGVLCARLQQVTIKDQQSGISEEFRHSKTHLLQEGEYIRLDISDTGKGIRREIINRIFDPFFTTKSKKQGTGLGLSVALGIVNKHQGKISVSSIPGQGTTFSVFLPLIKENKQNITTEEPCIKKGKEHILYIDDEQQVALTVTKMMSFLGYTVSQFTESKKALEAYKANPEQFDLIMTDYTMPVLTGLELIREINAFGCTIPIILITGYGDGNLIEESEKLGIASILMKPLSMEELSSVIRGVLDHPH